MSDLRVLFVDAPDQGYRAQLTDTRGRRLGAEVLFTPFLTKDDYEDLRWYLEDYMDLPDGGAVVRAQRIERELERWGSQLYDTLFSAAENHTLLSQLLAGPEPRRLTIVTKDPELLRLPWELVADEEGSLAQRLSVRRQLEEPKEVKLRPAQLPLRILYIVSRPSNAGFIDPRFTAKALLDALESLGDNVRVDFCRPPTLERMEEMLCIQQEIGDPFNIVHFDGHGDFKEKRGVLCFEEPADAFGRAAIDAVSAIELGTLLSRHTISLVILEACRTATVGPTTVFGSVAPHLMDAGVGSVLAMSHTVHVEATRLLMGRFYSELVRGATIDEAVSAARQALRNKPSRWLKAGPDGRRVELRDWFLPHLYSRAADAALVPSITHSAEGAAGTDFRHPATREEAGAFPLPPQFGFRGRARELHMLERRLREKRGLVLHAMGGMGKTALATEAAHWWTRSGLFRDGACFLSFEQFISADRVVQVLGTYLAGPQFGQLLASEQRRCAIELFQQKSVLLVWDNFESVLPQFNNDDAGHPSLYTIDERHRLAELFLDLTEGPGKGCLLVTCRPGESGLPGAQRYELEGLACADSLWLLASILEREGLTLNDRLSRDKLDPLLRDLADHPLSLELVGPHLRTMAPDEIRADFAKLVATFNQEAPEERNQSLLASLEFSLRHLSPAARKTLPWLGLFRGGVFESVLLAVSELSPESWKPIRSELEGIALLRAKYDLRIGDRPFLSFHPTLTSTAVDPTLAQDLEIRKRFLGVYRALEQYLYKLLTGPQPRTALAALSCEEANYRTAVNWAVADQQLPAAGELGATFSRYLQMSGRLRERDAWVQWLKNRVGRQGFTKEVARYERQHAWTRFTQGDPQGAVHQLQALIERLRHTAEFDPAFQLASTIQSLGGMLDSAGVSAQAIPTLQDACNLWEALVEGVGGRPWEELLSSPHYAKAEAEFGGLSATMTDLANAFCSAGEHREALAVAEKAFRIDERIGDHREVAVGHGQCASILRAMGRYDEADARYDLALAAARRAGDKELAGSILQHQGVLADDLNQLDRASRLFRQVLGCFKEVGNLQGELQTCNLLGAVDQKAGRLAEARAWYEKSRELAGQLKDQPGLGQAAHNIGIVWQLEGEATRELGAEPAARQCFEEARRSVEDGLRVWQSISDKPAEAMALGQLAQVEFWLGNLVEAEQQALRGLAIDERLQIALQLPSDYRTLAVIAQARGDIVAAAEWANKRAAVLAELGRRGSGSFS